MNIASAIQALRSRWELRILSEISQILVKPFTEEFAPGTLYQKAVDALVDSATPFKACVLRIGQGPERLDIVARSGNSITWEKRIDDSAGGVDGFAMRVYASSERIVVERIESRQAEFKNHDWIVENDLKSYACLPVKLVNRVLGTLSVFTGYEHKFDAGDFYFLDNIAFLIATVLESVRVVDELRIAREDLAKERDLNLGSAHEAGYSLSEADLHQYKLILQHLLGQFRQADSMSPGRIARVMREQTVVIQNALTKIDQDLHRTEHGRVDVNAVIKKILTYFSKETKGTNIKFTRELGELPEIEANELEIKDVILNLVSNAVKAVQKAARKEGEIRVQTKIVDVEDIEYIELIFTDNGTGIRNEDKERVFHKGYSSYEGGTGMGLFITRRIVDKYGGKLYFTSTLGKSTEFFIRLPLNRLRWEEGSE